METEIHLKRTHDFSHAGSQLRNVIAAARVQLRASSCAADPRELIFAKLGLELIGTKSYIIRAEANLIISF